MTLRVEVEVLSRRISSNVSPNRSGRGRGERAVITSILPGRVCVGL